MQKIQLRDYQIDIIEQLLNADSSKNLLVQLDTGAGKTVIIADYIKKSHNKNIVLIAHRNILISQASTQLAKHGILHRVIASKSTIKNCALANKKATAKSYVSQESNVIIASIDTLISHRKTDGLRFNACTINTLIVDEAHHLILDNKFHKLSVELKNCQVIGFTATPCRADGASLSRTKQGVFDELVQSKLLKNDSVNILIQQGFLSDFVCYRMKDDDIEKGVLAQKAYKAYKKYASSSRCIVFCETISNADLIQEEFRRAGISCDVIHSNKTQAHIKEIMDNFEHNSIKVLCSVDMIGEGYDCPAVDAVILMRPTSSFGLHRQQMGRALRPMTGKQIAIIIDLVGNVIRHGLPDRIVNWTLDSMYFASDKTNLIACEVCDAVNFAWLTSCKECGCKFNRDNAIACNNEVEYKYLDIPLIEAKRHKIIEAEKRKELNAKIYDVFIFDSSAIKAITAQKYAETFISNVRSIFENADINDFFHNKYYREHLTANFWLSQFSAKEIKVNNNSAKQKCFYLMRNYANKIIT